MGVSVDTSRQRRARAAVVASSRRTRAANLNVQELRRGTDKFHKLKAKLTAKKSAEAQLICRRRISLNYVRKILVEEEEDTVDVILLLVDAEDVVHGFALLTKKLLAPWTPPGWKWEYTDTDGTTTYTHTASGRTVVDDLDAVWHGRDETDADVFHKPSLHILLLCAKPGYDANTLVSYAESMVSTRRMYHPRVPRERIKCLSLGAVNAKVARHYATKYGFHEDGVCDDTDAPARRFVSEWNRAYEETGLYGRFMSKKVTRKKVTSS